MSETEYRTLLKTFTGGFSSRNKQLTQRHFDVFMAALEAKVEAHAEAVEAALPRQIEDLGYWRGRCPEPGMINSRIKHRITNLWQALRGYMPAHEWHHGYLMGIASKACRQEVAHIHDLKAWQAKLTIEALKDRLKHAMRRAG